jgi:branched-chain amino acid transport system substrate-binding protein
MCAVALMAALLIFSGASAAEEEKIIRIGALYPLTGAYASAGYACLDALRVTADTINAEGLLDGYKIVVIAADTQSKPDIAAAEAERLYDQEKVFTVIGAYDSPSSASASAVAERLKQIFMCGASKAAELTERGYEYFFRIAATDGIESGAFAEFIDYLNINRDADIRTLGLIYEDSAFGRHAAREGKRAAESIGLEVIADVPFTIGAPDMEHRIQALKSSDPDAVFAVAAGKNYQLMIRGMKRELWTPRIFINYRGGYQSAAVNEELGVDGNFFMGAMDRPPEISEAFSAAVFPERVAYRGGMGYPLDTESIQEAACLSVLAQAIEIAGTVDREKVASALRAGTFSSPLSLGGEVAFSPGGQNNRASVVITQMEDGKYRTVFPGNYADSDAVMPFPAWHGR